MRDIVALWAPDIEPPADWLVPAILYQDKVAIFAPEPYLDERDGRVSRRMKNILGDLYEPVSLPATFHGNEVALQEFRNRLPTWIERAARIDPQRKTYISRWADRALQFEVVRGSKARRLMETDETFRALEGSVRKLKDRLTQLDASLRSAEKELEALKAAARVSNEASRNARRIATQPLVERIRPLMDHRATVDPNSEEHEQISRELELLRINIRRARRAHSNPRNAALEATGKKVGDLRAQVADARKKLFEPERQLSKLRQERVRDKKWIDTPYGDNDRSALDPGFRAEQLWGLPRELDTIAVGKVYGPLFEFLATEGRLWVATRPDRSYAGTLVGPKFVVEDVMMIMARHVSEERSDCVLMTRGNCAESLRRNAGIPSSVATISWLLPTPRTNDLQAVRSFRERHEAELQDLRTYLRASVTSAETPKELEDAVREIEASCQQASCEIARALALDRRIGLTHVRESVVSEVGSTLRDVTTAAALGSIPVLSSVFNTGDAISGIPSGLVVAGIALAGRAAVDSARAHVVRRRIPSPFLYSYEAIRDLHIRTEGVIHGVINHTQPRVT